MSTHKIFRGSRLTDGDRRFKSHHMLPHVQRFCFLNPPSARVIEQSEEARREAPYLRTFCRWPRPGWWTPTPAEGRDSRRSCRWPHWTRSSLPLHSRRASRRSILGLPQSTPPSPVLTRPWSCNNWFFFFCPAPPQQMPHSYWCNWREQLNSMV